MPDNVRRKMVYSPPAMPGFNVLYKDEDFIVVNKPSGLLSVPGKAFEHRDSLQLRLQRVWPSLTVVHRLDMATSGIIIFALNKSSHKHIQQQFEKRRVKKTYYARVLGCPDKSQGEVTLPLICDWPNRPKQKVDHEIGKHAITRYEVVSNDNCSSLVKLNPITGRSHQLRVHMLALGHPILGDRLYACDEARSMSPRLCLHASKICFTHPSSLEPLIFESHYNFN